MSKKKGLSIDEKVIKVEEFFHENQQPYTAKELIVLIPKAKGVIHQSIEECLELLVSERRISQEKIGVSVFFWYFPINKDTQRAAQYYDCKERERRLIAEVAAKKAAIAAREAEIGDISHIEAIQASINDMKAQKTALLQKLALCAERDPVVVAQCEQARDIALKAANRWTDNIFLIEDYVCKRMGITRRDFRAEAHIPMQLSYLD